MLSLFLIFTSIFSTAGDTDLSVGFVGRTLPIAGQLEAIGGYGQTLWGDPGLNNQDPWYGFVRPSVTVRGPSTPTGLVALDIFPVSFFGFAVGRSYMLRLVEQPEIDCDRMECLEWMNYTYAQLRAYGKWQQLFVAMTYEKTYFDEMDDLTRPVFQSNNAVVQDPNGDRGDELFANVGYEWNEAWSAGVTLQYFKSKNSDNRQEMQLIFARYLQNGWTWTAGAGRFYSSPLGTGIELTGIVSWEIQKRLGYR